MVMLTGSMSVPASGNDRAHLPVLVTQRRLSPWRWLAPFFVGAIALRMIPIALGDTASPPADEGQAAAMSSLANRAEQAGQTFPGSAYFFAEGAFDSARAAGGGAVNGLDPQWQGNKHILAIDIGPPAAPYRFVGRTVTDRLRAISCLTNAIYYEAGNEPVEGQRAVAQVVLNRLRHPEWPDTVCGVVYQGTERADLRCQFTFSCNGAMAGVPDSARWLRARRVAEGALRGEVFAPAGLATFYHTLTVFPGWASRMHAAAIIGAHIFYRTPGADGMPARFGDRYAGIETISGPSANAYLAPQGNAAIPSIPVLPFDSAATIMPATVSLPTQPMPATALPAPGGKALPQSGDIKPEYRNSGRILK